MPECHYCGRQMTVLKHSTSGISGGGGARYRCPNTPHPRCPDCGHTLVVPLMRNSLRRDFGKLFCCHCNKEVKREMIKKKC